MQLWLVLFFGMLALLLVPAVLVLRSREQAARERLKSAVSQVVAQAERPVTSVVLDTAERPRSRADRLFELAGIRDAAGNTVKPPSLVAAQMGGCAVAGLVAGFGMRSMFGAAAIPMGALAASFIPIWLLRHAASKRLKALEEQLPDALDFLARSVRSGNALSVSFETLIPETTEPLRSEFVRLTREQALGASLDSALRGLVLRAPLVELRFFVAAVLLHRETGGNLSDILTKLSQSIRERLRLQGQVQAASAQGRLTARVLSILPFAVVAGMKMISPAYFSVMTDEPIGRAMLGAALVSEVIGFCVMQKIVDIEI